MVKYIAYLGNLFKPNPKHSAIYKHVLAGVEIMKTSEAIDWGKYLKDSLKKAVKSIVTQAS